VSKLLGRQSVYSTSQGMERNADALPSYPADALSSLLPRISRSLGVDDRPEDNATESPNNDSPSTPPSTPLGRGHDHRYRRETNGEGIHGPPQPSGRRRLADRQRRDAGRGSGQPKRIELPPLRVVRTFFVYFSDFPEKFYSHENSQVDKEPDRAPWEFPLPVYPARQNGYRIGLGDNRNPFHNGW